MHHTCYLDVMECFRLSNSPVLRPVRTVPPGACSRYRVIASRFWLGSLMGGMENAHNAEWVAKDQANVQVSRKDRSRDFVVDIVDNMFDKLQ